MGREIRPNRPRCTHTNSLQAPPAHICRAGPTSRRRPRRRVDISVGLAPDVLPTRITWPCGPLQSLLSTGQSTSGVSGILERPERVAGATCSVWVYGEIAHNHSSSTLTKRGGLTPAIPAIAALNVPATPLVQAVPDDQYMTEDEGVGNDSDSDDEEF